jgi:hypothetical protein
LYWIMDKGQRQKIKYDLSFFKC